MSEGLDGDRLKFLLGLIMPKGCPPSWRNSIVPRNQNFSWSGLEWFRIREWNWNRQGV